jgi:FtsP/CotA-like multicopper oxidase with cupredoxin domain
MRPTFASTPGAYTGPVPIVTRLHGAAGVGDESDGYAEAWFLPAVGDIPRRLRHRGHLVRLLQGQGQVEAQFLVLPAITALTGGTTRRLALLEKASEFFEDSPVEALLGTVDGDPSSAPAPTTPREWMDPVTENPAVGATEVWEYYNATADAHPMHIHEVTFQVVNRQNIVVQEDATVQVDANSAPTPPEAWENGWKDTVVAYPGQVTRLRLRFAQGGQFVWHCHIVEHEDNEMMRPYRIGPVQPGQPSG